MKKVFSNNLFLLELKFHHFHNFLVDRRLIMNESPFPHEYLKMWPELRSDDHTDDTFRFTTLELMGPQSLSPTMLPTSSAVYSTVSFYYTGSEQIYAVPNGVTSITVDMAGGAGGSTVAVQVEACGP